MLNDWQAIGAIAATCGVSVAVIKLLFDQSQARRAHDIDSLRIPCPYLIIDRDVVRLIASGNGQLNWVITRVTIAEGHGRLKYLQNVWIDDPAGGQIPAPGSPLTRSRKRITIRSGSSGCWISLQGDVSVLWVTVAECNTPRLKKAFRIRVVPITAPSPP
jgi:hypothetical protein